MQTEPQALTRQARSLEASFRLLGFIGIRVLLSASGVTIPKSATKGPGLPNEIADLASMLSRGLKSYGSVAELVKQSQPK